MYSMTGYGKGVASELGTTVTVEIKSVNHRYLDLSLKIPRLFLYLEDYVRKTVGKKISRGHLDVYLTYEKANAEEGELCVDVPLAKRYVELANMLKCEFPLIKDDFTLTSLMKSTDVIRREQAADDEELLSRLTAQALNAALQNLVAMRKNEGEKLQADIAEKLNAVERSLNVIKTKAPLVVEKYREELNARIAEVLEPNKIDMQRLATEVALYADHCAVDEETTRLAAHILHVRNLFDLNEPVGRKIEFLVQELNRETNTIGSKANDLAITDEVLKIKNEIEKIREQSANVE